LLLSAITSGSGFAGPLILNALLKHLSGEKPLPEYTLGILVALIFLAPLTGNVCNANSLLILNRIGIRIRNALVAAIFSKAVKLSPAARQANSGTINNIFANDTQQLQMISSAWIPLFFAPIQVAVGLYLIYRQVGVATFVGFAYIVGVMPFLVVCGIGFGTFIKRKLVHSDNRIKLTNEVFSGIRILKYYAWEDPFSKKLRDIRELELKEISSIYFCFIVLTLILESLPTVQPILIYYTYTRLGNELDYTTAFTTLTLFMTIQGPLSALPNLFTSIGYTRNACRRILNILNEEEIDDYRDTVQLPDSPDEVVVLENASFAWVKETQIAPVVEEVIIPVIVDKMTEYGKIDVADSEELEKGVNRGLHTISAVTLRVKRGDLVGILGSVGSGKSSLLSGLLGEMYLTGGSVRVCGTIAYHQQQPWILNMTIQENILFGLPYDEVSFLISLLHFSYL
jgi:ABC-type multidrug transport system fused ATPase/permease subunit